MRGLKTAIVHDWLTSPGGAERVLASLIDLYPDADIFTVCDVLAEEHRGFLKGKVPITTFIQRLPFAKRFYRSYLPLMPFAIEQLDMSPYDLILSSSHAVAKGILTGPTQLHICYIHTPIRYAWDRQAQYLREGRLGTGMMGWLARAFLHYMRIWDLRSAVCVDAFVSNSEFVARQVRRLYGQGCHVIYPPVAVEEFPLAEARQDFYVTVSRLVPYKRVDLIVRAFAQMPTRRLIVIGEGPEKVRIEAEAKDHPNITIMGYQTKAELYNCVAHSRAFIFAAIEDFGLSPVEAQACGTPVIACGRGGALETIRGLSDPFPTGVFFNEQTEEAIIEAIECFEQEESRITHFACRDNALRFSKRNFEESLKTLIDVELTTLPYSMWDKNAVSTVESVSV